MPVADLVKDAHEHRVVGRDCAKSDPRVEARSDQLIWRMHLQRQPCLDIAQVARQVLGDDLVLLACLDVQIGAAEAKLAQLLPDTPFAPLTTVPGWGTIRAGNYGAAVGDPRRWFGARQLYRASGLSPAQYESAGKRRDGGISREGSVALRRALIDLGIGLWHADPAARRYGQQLRARGKKGGVIGCAMANRANKIAYALVRDQSGYDPNRWA